jgi:hypothetical protein
MKIVNLDQFLELPENTVFTKYKPCCFDDLCIKGESIMSTGDFFFQQITDAIDCDDCGEFVDLLNDSEKKGTSVNFVFNCQLRDGTFNEGQLFAVWEKADVKALIDRLQECL